MLSGKTLWPWLKGQRGPTLWDGSGWVQGQTLYLSPIAQGSVLGMASPLSKILLQPMVFLPAWILDQSYPFLMQYLQSLHWASRASTFYIAIPDFLTLVPVSAPFRAFAVKKLTRLHPICSNK